MLLSTNRLRRTEDVVHFFPFGRYVARCRRYLSTCAENGTRYCFELFNSGYRGGGRGGYDGGSSRGRGGYDSRGGGGRGGAVALTATSAAAARRR